MLAFCFETLELHRVQAACGPENTGSQVLLERLGFQREGVMRDHVFTNGAWRDSVLYSLLRHEFEASGRWSPAPRPTGPTSR
jgi:RimJ/RimL family protein N-acetyltransferase